MHTQWDACGGVLQVNQMEGLVCLLTARACSVSQRPVLSLDSTLTNHSHSHCPHSLSLHPTSHITLNTQVQSLIMVGDPQQLPPTVRCQEAQRLGLGFSLFERVQAMGLKPLLLDTQYRMHPRLAEFPSAKFYGGLLQSWPKPSDRPLPPGLSWPNPQVQMGLSGLG